MAVSDASALRLAVYNAISAARTSEGESESTLPIYDHAPAAPPARFLRMEGFDIADDSFKDTERGRHSVQVAYFDSAGARGQGAAMDVLNWVHVALKDLRVGRGRMQFEFMDVESGGEAEGDHGILRYTITI